MKLTYGKAKVIRAMSSPVGWHKTAPKGRDSEREAMA